MCVNQMTVGPDDAIYFIGNDSPQTVTSGSIIKFANGVFTDLADIDPFTVSAIAVDKAGTVYLTDYVLGKVRAYVPLSQSCIYSITPSTLSLAAGGGVATVNLQTQPGCSWNVGTIPSWINSQGSTSGISSATLSFTVGANSGDSRIANISVGGTSFTIAQASQLVILTTQEPMAYPGLPYFQNMTASGVRGATTGPSHPAHCRPA